MLYHRYRAGQGFPATYDIQSHSVALSGGDKRGDSHASEFFRAPRSMLLGFPQRLGRAPPLERDSGDWRSSPSNAQLLVNARNKSSCDRTSPVWNHTEKCVVPHRQILWFPLFRLLSLWCTLEWRCLITASGNSSHTGPDAVTALQRQDLIAQRHSLVGSSLRNLLGRNKKTQPR